MRCPACTPVAIRVVIATLVFAASSVARAVPANTTEDVRRLLTLLAAVGEEYREGVRDGVVVRPVEFEEAQSFLQDAQQRCQHLGADLASDEQVSRLFTEIAAAVDGKAPANGIADKLAALRQRVVALTGVSEQIYPPASPSAVRGQQLFGEYCATCHGSRGDGKGPSAAGLTPPPANFTDAQFMHGETPYDFYHVISLGKRGTAMPAWDGVLSIQDRWDLVSYLWTLPVGSAAIGEGQGVYLAHCASCHGASGDGQGVFHEVLVKPAPDLTQPQTLARQTDAELFAAATDGMAGTPMPAFGRTLRDDERWKAVGFMRVVSLGGPASPGATTGGGPDSKRFAGLLRLLGRTYAQAWSGAIVADTVEYDKAVALLENVSGAGEAIAQSMQAHAPHGAVTVRAGVAAIAKSVRERAPATTVTAAVDELVAFVESAAVPETVPAAAASAADAVDTALAESERLLAAALAAYGRAEPGAAGLASDAYLEFEPLEPRLGAAAAEVKARAEDHFLRLRQLLRTSGNDVQVHALVAAIHDDFSAVRAALRPHASPYALFLESATIILREGFEIVLVIGALMAYVVKTGNPGMRRSIYAGTAIGVAASLATAFLMGELLRLHPGSSDLLEGLTMLLAAVVLFWVSYWLISKAEADKWQRYIRGKVESALTGRRSVALAGAAFLAVYREGFETVLFYQALYASAPTASMTVTAGFVAGALVLLLVYAAFRWFEVQIPIRQFFFVTGLLLYAMAAVFAGQGIYELQEAGWVSMTPLAWVPALPLLGVYPSVESVLVQLLFVALLAYATAVTLRRRARLAVASADAEIGAEVRALRGALDALRDELRALRAAETGQATAIAERVEGAVLHVEQLAGHVVKLRVNGGTNGGGQHNGR
jgi:FTR1 family protein